MIGRRFPLILEATSELRVRSCLIDGEAVACDDNGLAVFDCLRRKHNAVFLYAFDLLELDGVDLRRELIETRKADARQRATRGPGGAASQRALRALRRGGVPPCLPDGAGRHRVEAARLALVSGRTKDWLKFKNPAAPAVKREAEEDWGR
jgi:bifunctional non-homologous end joining protein LigD